MSLNPVKISGTCGRLMCCLKYEQNAYDDLLRITPRVGAIVTTPDGRGMVEEVSLLTGQLKVRLDQQREALPRVYSRKDVKIIKDGRGKIRREEPEPAAQDVYKRQTFHNPLLISCFLPQIEQPARRKFQRAGCVSY